MLKKISILLLNILLGLSAFAQSNDEKADPIATEVQISGQIEAIPQTTPSEEVNYVEVSELTRKMEQAKKAENARKYDSYGGGITIIAMCIVIGALVILSILFFIFGNISSWFISRKKKQTVKTNANKTLENSSNETPDSGEVIAAISAALTQHFGTDHDMQDTILTIRRMKKSYSPWNSKIYNMRQLPVLAHNQPKSGKR